MIHASRKVDTGMFEAFDMPEDLPKGVLMGEAFMTDVVQYNTKDRWLEEMDKHLNRPEWFEKGLYGFVFTDQTQYALPIPCKGRLNFFDVDIYTSKGHNLRFFAGPEHQ
ncbi:MAG: hypothetical protein BA872_08540 [Desulfobacterales bacterium C00003060]|nr:MAG: hypothetical protein BA872_08540 [Desulfobacterales bacterium C00003060]